MNTGESNQETFPAHNSLRLFSLPRPALGPDVGPGGSCGLSPGAKWRPRSESGEDRCRRGSETAGRPEAQSPADLPNREPPSRRDAIVPSQPGPRSVCVSVTGCGGARQAPKPHRPGTANHHGKSAFPGKPAGANRRARPDGVLGCGGSTEAGGHVCRESGSAAANASIPSGPGA